MVPRRYRTKIAGTLIIAWIYVMCATMSISFALPQIDEVKSGSAQATYSDNNSTLTITATDKAIINYKSFDIAEHEKVFITLPSASSEVLNRVTGPNASFIYGSLSSNGIVYLVNPNGITIGPNASINAASLVLSTRDITNTNFLNSNYVFEKFSNATLDRLLVNRGTITIKDGGFGVLIAGGIDNTGVITARVGTIALASGDMVNIHMSGENRISVAVTKTAAAAIVDADGNPVSKQLNTTGKLQADGGTVTLEAESISDVFEQAINIEGYVKANTIEAKDGTIRIVTSGSVGVNATLEAGRIDISAKDVTLSQATHLVATDRGIAIAVTGNITTQAEIETIASDIDLFADYDRDGVGQFTQSAGTIKAGAQGNVHIDGSGTMTLKTIQTDTGAIRIGTRQAPATIAGNPHYIHTQGDIDIVHKETTPAITTLTTTRNDVLRHSTTGTVTLEAVQGKIIDRTLDTPIPAQYLRLIAQDINVRSDAITTEIYRTQGDLIITATLPEANTNYITLTGEHINVTYLKTNNVTLKSDGLVATEPGAILTGNTVTVIARQFGKNTTPLAIDAVTTHITRTQGPIDILASTGIGTSILLRGPPEDGFGSILYTHTTKLTLDAIAVRLISESPTYLYGDITFYNFACTIPDKEIYFEAGHTYTFRGSVTIVGAPGSEGLIKLLSSASDNRWHADFSDALTTDIRYVALKDAASATPIKVAPSTNWGNCTGFDTDPVWDGGGANEFWSNPLNWDTDTVPTQYDTVTFNQTSHKNATIDPAFGGTIATFIIDGYQGTITLGRSLTITSSYTQRSGTFIGGTSEITVAGSFTHAGGLFYCPQANMYLQSDVSVAFESFFQHAQGKVYIKDYSVWLAFVQQVIAWEEYLPKDTNNTDHWVLVNPNNRLRARISADGWTIEYYDPQDPDFIAWSWKYTFVGIGRDGGAVSVYDALANSDIYLKDNAVILDHGTILEWYRNTFKGIEQGFTITTKPDGSGELIIKGLLTTNLTIASQDGTQITFKTASGLAFTYNNLKVYDAHGNAVAASMRVEQEGAALYLILRIDDANALYPLTVDPISSTPAWTENGENVADYFGASVASAGDVNGDGYSDIIIGAPIYLSYSLEGRVYVYHGSVNGLPASANWAKSAEAGSVFGFSVASAGDVNGDGYSDVIIGAPGTNSGAGKIYAWYGSATGLSTGDASWYYSGTTAGELLGSVVASAGDVNGDGYSDIIAGAPEYNPGGADKTGKAYVWYSTGIGGLGASERPADWTKNGEAADNLFGYALASAGDVNGDGYSDVIIGAYGNDSTKGKAYLWHGSALGLGVGAADWTKTGDTAGDDLGHAVASAGDVNGDGYSDIIITAPYYGLTDIGRAYVYRGSASGIVSTGFWMQEGELANSAFGYKVAPAGDVNGDGYSDVIIGAENYNGNTGKAYLWYGSSAGLRTGRADWTQTGEAASNFFGWSVASAGDVNGDGYSDIIISAQNAPSAAFQAGKVYVFYGAADSLSQTSYAARDGEANSQLGYCVAGAGDVNGDGYADVIISAPRYSSNTGKVYVWYGSRAGIATTADWTKVGENGDDLFGWSVASAGDVNGDGYSDVIIGAFTYSTGIYQAGKAYVWHGSRTGLSTGTAYWTKTGAGIGYRFGQSVASAGDVNGDGYGDVIIGAPGGGATPGNAYVWYGSSSGLNTGAANWSQSGEAGGPTYFGWSVASAGDVNGDGFSDVIIGAPGNGTAGKVYVWHGASSGLNAGAANWDYESALSADGLGQNVASAGDVNGDGYDDIIAGAYRTSIFTGKAYAWYGSAAGLPAGGPDWEQTGEAESNHFGWSVATAGDVNGDGYSDVIVGALYGGAANYGKIYIWYGASSGLGAGSADWTYASAESWEALGNSVASAGDVNGDGYNDIIIGAYGYNTAAGRAYIYFGNNRNVCLPSDWSVSSTGDSLGQRVASAGDVNGDGYSDVMMYASGGTNTGTVYLYYGSAHGLSANADWAQSGENSGDRFGFSLACAGDVNGDGYDDIIIGAETYTGAFGGPDYNRGKAYVFYGSTTGPGGIADWTATGEASGDYFGYCVASAGDVNGDRYDDVIIGAIGSGSSAGKIYVFYGSAAGLPTPAPAEGDWHAHGEAASDVLGGSVASAGDVNGDGYDDIIVGAYGKDTYTGKVYVWYGSASGLTDPAPVEGDWHKHGEDTNNYFGWSVASAGDVNGDGYSDVIIGAFGYSTNTGKAYVWYGSVTGLGAGDADWTKTGEAAADVFGYCVASAGDVNGDGYSDVVIDARGYHAGRGKIYIWLGASAGLPTDAANVTQIGSAELQWLGGSVASAGDVNGDGYSDIIIGSVNPVSGNGIVYVYFMRGPAAGGVSSLATSTWIADGSAGEYFFGYSGTTAGDVNGDGYDDIIIPAPYTPDDKGKVYAWYGSRSGLSVSADWSQSGETANDLFGQSAASAGDVNGDGYGDIIVGASGYATNTGRIYVYYGSASGLSDVGSSTRTGATAGDQFGWSVASAGDINGDGYDDVIIGADGANASAGKVYVYRGSASGITDIDLWTHDGEEASGGLGFSVASAGDVNGDGYSDVIVGARAVSLDTGKAYLWYGSASGLSSTAGGDWSVTGEAAGDYFGNSVASAGDVNGDGYDDIIIGAYGYGAFNGKAYLWYGAETDLSTTPVWTYTGNAGSSFAASVACAGDVNGDGYSDIIIGAPDESLIGAVYVWHGSRSGCAPTGAQWSAAGPAAMSYFGDTVASAGDINGDGYSDIIVSAPNYNSIGRAYVYLGSGIAPLTQQLTTGDTVMQPLAMADGTSFQIRLFARSAFGRTDVKLFWEVAEAGTPFGTISFDGSSSSWTDTGTKGVWLTETVSGLNKNTTYQWRARLQYADGSYSPWYSSVSSYNEHALATGMNIGGAAGANIGNAVPLTLVVNAGERMYTTTTTDGSGTFTFENIRAETGEYILIFTNDGGTHKANLVGTVADNTADIAGLAMTADAVVLGDADGVLGTTFTNTTLANAYYSDSNVYYVAAIGGTADFTQTLSIAENVSYSPDGVITIAGDLLNAGTLNAPASITVSGNWWNTGAFYHNSGTVILTSPNIGMDILTSGYHFNALTLNSTGGTGNWAFIDNAFIDDDLTISAGSLIGILAGAGDITVRGDVAGEGTITLTGGTFSVYGTGLFGGSTNNWVFYNLTFGNGDPDGSVTTKTGTNSVTIKNLLTVAPYHELKGGVSNWSFSWDTGVLDNVTQITGGWFHSLALRADGTVWAWGYNNYGQLGDGTITERTTPVEVVGAGGSGYLSDIIQVSAGWYHSLAVKSDGTVWAWGENSYGELGNGSSGFGEYSATPVQTTGMTNVKQVSGGGYHSLALRADGTIWAWGYNNYGQLGNGSSGGYEPLPVQTTGLMAMAQVCAAGYSSVALKSDGTVWAWGYNGSGQLGINAADADPHATPAQVLGAGGVGFLTGVIKLAGGNAHIIALKSDGTVWAWGGNTNGQLGDNTTTPSYVPIEVHGADDSGFLTGIKDIAAYMGYTVALRSDGTVWAWGYNNYGCLGDNTLVERHTPVQATGIAGIGYLGNIRAIASGGGHTLALASNGMVYAWGQNNHGQLGYTVIGNFPAPVRTLGSGGTAVITNMIQISSGYDYTIALRADGTVWAWGENNYGQLGDNTTTNRVSPVQVLDDGGTGVLDDIIQVSAGEYHVLALDADGTVWAWGDNSYGQLGDNTIAESHLPVHVHGVGDSGTLSAIKQITAGGYHSVTTCVDGNVYTWGRNDYGQLGDGTTTDRHVPVLLATGNVVTQASAGEYHTLGLVYSGYLYAFGRNNFGQLGTGPADTDPHPNAAPVLGVGGVGDLSDIVQVNAGAQHTVACDASGNAYAWGENIFGELGDGSAVERDAPIQVHGVGDVGFLENIKQITAGAFHTVAVAGDGTAYAWGSNLSHQLGDGTDVTNRSTPVAVVSLAGVTQIGAGTAHSVALTDAGMAYGWGDNQYGQIGNGTTTECDIATNASSLVYHGPFVIAGTFTAENSTVTYETRDYIDGSHPYVASTTYATLYLSRYGTTTPTYQLDGAITTTSDLHIFASTSLDVTSNNYAIAVGGDWTNDGTFNARAGTVIFNGSAMQAINSATTWYILKIDNTAGDFNTAYVWAASAQTVNDLLWVSRGRWSPASGDQYHDVFIENGIGSSTIYPVTLGIFFQVSGDWTNDDTFIPNTCTVIFNGTTALLGTTTSHTFYTITINGTLTGPSTLLPPLFYVAGNWANNGTFNHNNAPVIFSGGDSTIITGGTGAGKVFYDMTVSATGTKMLDGNLSVVRDFAVTGGAFATGAHDITVGRNFTASTGTFTAQAGSEVIFVYGAYQTSQIRGTTFVDFTCTDPGKILQIEAGATETITGTLTLTGTDPALGGERIYLRSLTSGSQWRLDPQGTRDITYVDVKDSNNISATIIYPTTDYQGSFDSGNTTNWFYHPVPPTPPVDPDPGDPRIEPDENIPQLKNDPRDPNALYEEEKFKKRYPKGKYRTTVILYEGRVVVTPYEETGLKRAERVELTAGQRVQQVGQVR